MPVISDILIERFPPASVVCCGDLLAWTHELRFEPDKSTFDILSFSNFAYKDALSSFKNLG